MRKVLLSLAVVLTAFSVNAKVTGFVLDSETYPAATLSGSNYTLSSNVTNLNSGIVVNKTSSCAELSLQVGAIASVSVNFQISDVSFQAQGPSSGSARISWKIYPNYVACNTGSGTPAAVIPTVSGDKITVTLGTSDTSNPISYTITGADKTTVSVAVGKQEKVELTATGAISISLPNKARVYAIDGKSSTSIENISVDSDKTIIDKSYYNLLGAKVDASATGIVIEKTIYTDGSVSSQKVLKK